MNNNQFNKSMQTIKNYVDEKIPSYKLTNKKWLAIGDSITAKTFHSEKNYHDFIAEKTGCTVTNYGKDGWTIVQMCNEISKMPTDVDVITLFMGTNDWHIGKVALGNFLDTGTSTVSGAINEMLSALLWKYGDKSILVFSPLPRYNGTQYGYNCSTNDRGFALLDLVDVLKKTCEHYSIPFLDLYRQSGFHMGYTQSRETYFTDGLHPNIIGHEILGNLMLSFMESNVKEYTKAVSETVPVAGISIQSAITLRVGESATLSAILTPSNATDKRVQWSCDNDNASISSNGVVTANKQGQSVVTVTTNDGGFTSQCTVTIEAAEPVAPPSAPDTSEIDGQYLTDFALAYTNISGNEAYYSYMSTGVINQTQSDSRAGKSLPILELKPDTYYRLHCSDASFYMNLSDYTEGKWKSSDKGDMYFKTGTSGKCRIHFSAGVGKEYTITLTRETWDGKTTELTD